MFIQTFRLNLCKLHSILIAASVYPSAFQQFYIKVFKNIPLVILNVLKTICAVWSRSVRVINITIVYTQYLASRTTIRVLKIWKKFDKSAVLDTHSLEYQQKQFWFLLILCQKKPCTKTKITYPLKTHIPDQRGHIKSNVYLSLN